MTPASKKKTTAKKTAGKKITGKNVNRKKVAGKKVTRKKAVGKKMTSKKAAGKKLIRKKVVRKKAVKAMKATAKKVARKSGKSTSPDRLSKDIGPEERWKLIAIAAYHRAERRGFVPGGELQDWVEAEKEVDELMSG